MRESRRGWAALWLAFVGYALFVLCRKAVPLALGEVSAEVSLEEVGLLLSAQSAAYSASKLAAGLLSGRLLGARAGLSAGLAAAGLAVAAFAWASTPAARLALWTGNGLAQGLGWPSCVLLLTAHFPPARLGLVWSLLSASANATGILAPLLLPALLVALPNGWRGFFLLTGSLSLAWASVLFLFLQEGPEKDSEQSSHAQEELPSWRSLLRSPFLWWLSLFYLVVFGVKTGVEYWASVWLRDERGLSGAEAGAFLAWFETGGFLGSFPTGWLSDRAVRRRSPESPSNPRMVVALALAAVAALSLQLLLWTESLLVLKAGGFALGWCLYGGIIVYGVVGSEEAGRLGPASHALVSLAANVGGVGAGWPLGALGLRHGWAKAFRLLQAALLLAAVTIAATLRSSHAIGPLSPSRQRKRD